MRNLLSKTGNLLLIAAILLSSNKIYSYGATSPQNNKPVAAGKTDETNNRVRILSDEAKYDRQNKTALAKGHVKIMQDNVSIYTASVLYNQGIHTSFIDQFVRIINLDKETKRKTDISANKMVAYHQEKKVHLENDVRFDREEDRKFQIATENKKSASNREKTETAIRRERSVITSDACDYWTKTGDAIFTGNVIVLQKEKKASGETVNVKNDSNKNTDTITLEKNAKLIQIKGEWLAKEGIIDPKEDKEKERLTKERLEMNADKIVIFQKSSNVIGDGNVKIVQKVANKQREATGEHSVYDDISKTMTLTGNVKIKRENEDWLTAEKAIFHSDSENFEAFSNIDETKPGNKQVESEFLIPDEDKKTPELPIGSPEPDFNLDQGKKDNSEDAIKNNTKKPNVKPSAKPVIKNPPQVKPTPEKGKSPEPKKDVNPYATPVPLPSLPATNPTPLPVQTPQPLNSSGELIIPTDN
jgi:lipopolysaccharide export system protein LptA